MAYQLISSFDYFRKILKTPKSGLTFLLKAVCFKSSFLKTACFKKLHFSKEAVKGILMTLPLALLISIIFISISYAWDKPLKSLISYMPLWIIVMVWISQPFDWQSQGWHVASAVLFCAVLLGYTRLMVPAQFNELLDTIEKISLIIVLLSGVLIVLLVLLGYAGLFEAAGLRELLGAINAPALPGVDVDTNPSANASAGTMANAERTPNYGILSRPLYLFGPSLVCFIGAKLLPRCKPSAAEPSAQS
ncbi:hypothetical protein KJI95_18915 [Shewanella sp. JM162201]|uniref:Uncharacterized protein n=1 Tax=Shewanella jiangmenensis TaxID=2837387 RepID=A0ABS5V805_9GAMM|nr:hypothetical protein [Shewanella jiangmenensis]MBT1446571.1 hypothetical protein [Shewanella jiangmenensis]